MLKKSFLISFMFTTMLLPDDGKSTIIPLEFEYPSLNDIKKDNQSGKSALEQFLSRISQDVNMKIHRGTGIPCGTIPLIKIGYTKPSLSSPPFPSYIEVFYPGNAEIRSEYALNLHLALVNSDNDLLVAAIYREMMLQLNTIINAGDFGIWKCPERDDKNPNKAKCYKLDNEEIRKALEKKPATNQQVFP